jgi:hypothetical protein
VDTSEEEGQQGTLMARSGHVETDSLALPFQGETTLARHCSHQGAEHAKHDAGNQCARMRALYLLRGPMTDQEMADALGIQRSTVNARRWDLIKRGHVQAVDTVKNHKTGVRNTRYGLIQRGC